MSDDRRWSRRIPPLLLLLLALPAMARAQSAPATHAYDAEHDDHRIVYEAGWAGDWSRSEGLHAAGALFGLEVTPSERWLAIEVSVAAIRGDDGTEMPIELSFKKPWHPSPRLELMAGVGPELVHAFGAAPETYAGLAFAAHVMVWPQRNLGWYLEPAYEITFPRDGTQHGVGLSVGLLIGR